jgi:hypothetical protein
MLGPVNSGRVRLPDNDRLLAELRGIVRRASGGTERATHLGGHHDDLAAAVAGVVYQLATKPRRNLGISLPGLVDWIKGRDEPKPEQPKAVGGFVAEPSRPGFSYLRPAEWIELAPGMWGPPELADELEKETAA